MYLIGSTYNFCCVHQALSKRSEGEAHRPRRQTPAMASGLTDHLWSLSELLRYKIPPASWVEPKRRGRPRTKPLPTPNMPKHPQRKPVTAKWISIAQFSLLRLPICPVIDTVVLSAE